LVGKYESDHNFSSGLSHYSFIHMSPNFAQNIRELEIFESHMVSLCISLMGKISFLGYTRLAIDNLQENLIRIIEYEETLP
jgi:hypothetical protein